ncbi:MAG: tRNA (adenosine(37)-N6)-threonylcarbamoyltransferase complex transferase subunit TsaD [Candidatus Omnitrophica bacterium]|nr:tRNA (adenosine(37)-N6)-threonylcarbamoyltransferase complex transferase subunit TsaD [Candidatus Omnitrophota bacterium]
MNILGIETSCDETAAAVVKNGKVILSNIVSSSLKEHQQYGGIIPEIASRRQMETIHAVVMAALKEAHLSLNDIHAFAVTQSPGFIGSLLVGLSYARALSFASKKPLIEINHIKAHIHANFLTFASDQKTPASKTPGPKLPAIGLIVSGGHTSLYYLKDFANYQLLGQTRDDAAGEAFDKVARILNLGYPGGPVIDKLARKGKNADIRFTCAALEGTLDFSFSGIKTAVLYYKNKYHQKEIFDVAKIAYAFQDSVVSVLINKCLLACRKKKVKTIVVGGGVAANSSLRKRLSNVAADHNINVFFPPLSLCVDNAAMVAGFAYHIKQYERNTT